MDYHNYYTEPIKAPEIELETEPVIKDTLHCVLIIEKTRGDLYVLYLQVKISESSNQLPVNVFYHLISAH